MSSNQSIYQKPSVAKQVNRNNVSPRTISSANNPVFVGNKTPSVAKQVNRNNVSPRTISSANNPVFVGNNLEEQKIQALEKIEEMKDKAETKSSEEVSNSTSKKAAIITASIILIMAGVTLFWTFYASKTVSGKSSLKASVSIGDIGESSGEWGKSSGKSAGSL
jgi:hypothetical protein